MSANGDESSGLKNHGSRIQPCRICQQRKVKCKRKDPRTKDPCTNCLKAGEECVLPPPKRKKASAHYSDLLIRLRRFEDALRGYGADIEEIARGEIGSRDRLPIRENQPSQSHQSAREVSPYLEKTNGTGLTDQFLDGEEILQSSSNMEILKDPIMATYDVMYNSDGERFVLGGSPSSDGLGLLHPPPVYIFRLWQIFLDRINPLTKILHAPTMQQKILEASSDLENVPESLEALMFSIYYFAATSLLPGESMTLFGEDQESMTMRYKHGVQQAFVNAGFLKSSDIVTLQAFVLYLSASLFNIDPRTHYSLTGLAVRIARRMGLDRDGSTHKYPPFHTEIRRRLWWRITILDLLSAEISGGGSPVIDQFWETKIPLNINDSDLYPDMKEPPIETTTNTTEMVFVLVGYQIASFLHTSRQSSSTKETLEQLETRIHTIYLAHLQTSLPFHNLTKLMAHSTLSRTYMILHHNRQFPKPAMNTTPCPTSSETITFVTHLITQLTCYNSILSLSDPSPVLIDAFDTTLVLSPNTKRTIKRSPYHWYTQKHYPFGAQILLLLFLRTPMFLSPDYGTEVSELVEKGWDVLNRGFFLKRMGGSRLARDAPINIALTNLTLQAWDSRVGNELLGMEEPGMVSVMRCERDERRRGQPGLMGIESIVNREGNGDYSDQRLGEMLDNSFIDEGYGLGTDLYSSSLFGMHGGDSGIGEGGFWGDLIQGFEI